MNFSISIILFIACFGTIAQSMVVPKYKNTHQLQITGDQKTEQKYKTKNISSFKAALATFTKCQKLRAKLMIRYRRKTSFRNKTLMLRRIKNLTLEC